ncbi:uncharacterized protein IAS62_005242 [Cryptococcus decagattii]|uniref:Nudix hydrolase domain-containing protein n=1 Tax=Cryptococcus decagattii TaxID=1859122 RepID=A0ABZ2AZC6_9TREE
MSLGSKFEGPKRWKSLEERGISSEALEGLTIESRECLERLANYDSHSVHDFGIVKRAAVLVALFQREADDKLHVLLTTRAKTLRRHPSQTALPGGKVDPDDRDATHTARREAFEEVNLPLEHPSIHNLTVLEPVMTILPLNAHMKNHIIVIPVVCFISDVSLLEHLQPSPDEVDAIFTHPLKGCLTGTVEGKDLEGLAEKGREWWPYEEEFHSIEDRIGTTGGYRMHRFRTKRTPIKGLTSDVLVHAASVAYGSPPAFGRFAPNQPPFSSVISNVVLELPSVIDQSITASVPGEPPRVLEWGGTGKDTRIISGEQYELV